MKRTNRTLLSAATYGDVEKIKKALENGADVNVKHENGSTALLNAARNLYVDHHAAGLKLLIEAGADVNAADRNGDTALIWSVVRKRSDCVVALIEAGADIECLKDDYPDDYQIGMRIIERKVLRTKAKISSNDDRGAGLGL